MNESLQEHDLPLCFRVMTRQELDVVLQIERRSFVQPWPAEFFLQELRLPFSRVILAEVVGTNVPIGYVCRWLTAGEVHVLNVAVHPDWRRQGIARRLLETVLEEAGQRDAEKAFLEVRRHNLAAISLYEGLGFREIGLRKNYYGPGEDARVMARKL